MACPPQREGVFASICSSGLGVAAGKKPNHPGQRCVDPGSLQAARGKEVAFSKDKRVLAHQHIWWQSKAGLGRVLWYMLKEEYFRVERSTGYDGCWDKGPWWQKQNIKVVLSPLFHNKVKCRSHCVKHCAKSLCFTFVTETIFKIWGLWRDSKE